MSESASCAFTKTVKSEAGERTYRVDRTDHSVKPQAADPGSGGGTGTPYPTDSRDGDVLPTDKHMPIR